MEIKELELELRCVELNCVGEVIRNSIYYFDNGKQYNFVKVENKRF